MENTQNKILTEDEKKSLRLNRFGESAISNTRSNKVNSKI
jgi:hypothetical protein